MTTDLSADQSLEDQLRLMQERFELAMRSVNDGVWDWNLETDHVFFSSRWKSIIGYGDGEIEHRIGEWERLVHPEDLPRAQALIDAHLRGESEVYEAEFRMRHKDGSDSWILARGAALRDESGRPYRMVGSHTDITQRKRAEEDLQRRVQERTRELTWLLHLSQSVSSTLELKSLLGLIVDSLKDIADYDGASLFLRHDDYLYVFDRQGAGDVEEIAHLRIAVNSFPAAWQLFQSGKSLIIEDVRGDDPMAAGWRSSVGSMANTSFQYIHGWMAAPVIHKDNVLGLLTLSSREAGHFTERHATMALAVARHAAVAIENARLYEQAQQYAATEERARLARELHDSVTQALFSMTLHARTTRMHLEREGIDASSPLALSLQKLTDLTRGALAEMRALLFELRPGALREEGLVAALRKQAAAMSAREEIEIDVRAPVSRLQIDERTEEQIYRLAQEALHNVVKHARASHVQIDIRADGDTLALEIVDDGVGFDAHLEHPGHMGLHTMADRAHALGGNLWVASTPGHGTTIRAAMPYSQQMTETGT